MTALEHSDRILTAQNGAWLMACEPVSGVNMREGGAISYAPGARFRVQFSTGGLLWALDEQARSVTFDRQELAALEFCQRGVTTPRARG